MVLNDCFASHRCLIGREPGPNYSAQGGDGNKGFFRVCIFKKQTNKSLPHVTEQPLFMRKLDKVSKNIMRGTLQSEILSYWGQQISSLCTSISCHKHCTFSHYRQS